MPKICWNNPQIQGFLFTGVWSLTICRTNLQMEFTMLKDCWNNPQIWGLLSPTWSCQDGTKSHPSSLHPLSPIHQPPSFPKVSHHDLHPRHQSYFSEYLIAFSKVNLVLTLLTGCGLRIFDLCEDFVTIFGPSAFYSLPSFTKSARC